MEYKQNWPSWRYGPDGQEGVFNSESEVPEGWADHPSKVEPIVKIVKKSSKLDL